MKKLHLFLATLLITFSLPAVSASVNMDTTNVETKIRNVTIFFNGAQVERKAKVSLQKGNQLIKVSGLSYKMEPKSLQVKGTGNLTILSVKHETQQPEYNKKSDESIRLNDEMASIRYEIQDLNNQNYVLGQEEKIIMENRSFKNEKGGIKIDDLKSAAEFYRQRLNEIRKLMLENNKKVDQLNKQITALNKELNLLNPSTNTYSSNLYISVLAKEDLRENIEISYYVASAGWKPMYEFRVEEVSRPVSIVYKATIYQTTGEDWDDVMLTLSSSNPTLKGEKPELRPWYINQRQPVYRNTPKANEQNTMLRGRTYDHQSGEALPYANVAVYQNNQLMYGANTDADGNFIINPINPGYYQVKSNYVGYNQYAQNINIANGQQPYLNLALQANYNEVEEVVVVDAKRSRAESYDYSYNVASSSQIQNIPAQSYHAGTTSIRTKGPQIQTINFISNKLKRNVANLEYSIDVPYTILSDGKENKVRIKEVKVPVEYVFHAVPQIDSDVFLTANIADWSQLNLLSGSSSIFYEGTFIGESYLDVMSIEDTMTISLGRDKNILVERTSDKEHSEKKIFGSTTKDFIAWEINVRNNRSTPIKVLIEEQIPISNNKDIEIELEKSSGARFDEKTGILKWEFEMEANKKETIEYKYVVKYPENIRINYQ